MITVFFSCLFSCIFAFCIVCVGCTALKNPDDLFQEHYHVSSITVNPQWNDDQKHLN